MTASGDWSAWMRDLGRQVRRAREFVGLSRERLARAAGVSQGAVRRLEVAQGLATPCLVVAKVSTALGAALLAVDPGILSDEARAIVAQAESMPLPVAAGVSAPLTSDPGLEEVIRLDRAVPKRQREALLAVIRQRRRRSR